MSKLAKFSRRDSEVCVQGGLPGKPLSLFTSQEFVFIIFTAFVSNMYSSSLIQCSCPRVLYSEVLCSQNPVFQSKYRGTAGQGYTVRTFPESYVAVAYIPKVLYPMALYSKSPMFSTFPDPYLQDPYMRSDGMFHIFSKLCLMAL